MKSSCKFGFAGSLLLLGLALAGSAQAIRVAGPAGMPTAAAPTSATTRTAPAPGNASTLDLATGIVQAVDPKKRTLTVGGRVVGLHPTGLRVIGPGGHAESGAGALHPGMHIRFALEPSTAAVRRIVLIYIERRP